MEFTLLWAALTGVGALYGSLWWMGRRDTSLCVRDLWEMALTAAVVGLAVVGKSVVGAAVVGLAVVGFAVVGEAVVVERVPT